MSLSGRLEDLQLRDLLQILGLGRNDGLLQLRCGCNHAELLFNEGLVFSAWRQETPYSGLRSAVVACVRHLLTWDEGDFSFQPGPLAETLQYTSCGEHLCLDNGLTMDELLRDEAVLPASNGAPVALAVSNKQQAVDDTPCVPKGDEPVAVLLVDDDPQISVQLVGALAQQGLAARSFGCGAELLSAVRCAWEAGQHPLLIVDLIMPRLHGGGILGGLELVEQIRSVQADQACLVYSDYPCPEVAQRLQKLGVDELLNKPRPQSPTAEDHSAVVTAFCNNLAVKAAALRRGSATIIATQPFTEPCVAPSAVEPETDHTGAHQGAGMGMLKGMLQELQTVESGDQVMLLVLRFATEILSRAVLFSVDKDRIVGLGQFGYGDGEHSADEKVRRIIVPLTEPSSFKEVIEQPAIHCGPLGKGHWDRYLLQELEIDCSGEVFIGPLLRDGQVVALLCGDNQNSGCVVDDSPALEIFLQQAGVALENLHMADKLRNLSALLGKTFDC